MSKGEEERESDLRCHWKVGQGLDHRGHIPVLIVYIFSKVFKKYLSDSSWGLEGKQEW